MLTPTICPQQSVYQCDFLKLELIPSLAHSPSSDDLDLVPLTSKLGLTPEPTASPMTQLPRASFQVVVFSLLLEYLPASVQRWACCVKAHSLLVPHGLLLIVTPDSNRFVICSVGIRTCSSAFVIHLF